MEWNPIVLLFVASTALFFIIVAVNYFIRRNERNRLYSRHISKHLAQAFYVGLIFYSVFEAGLDEYKAASLILLGILLIETFTSLLGFLKFHEPIGMERHFGGLGGGLGGWSLTRSTSYLLLSIILIIGIVLVDNGDLRNYLQGNKTMDPTDTQKDETGTKASPVDSLDFATKQDSVNLRSIEQRP